MIQRAAVLSLIVASGWYSAAAQSACAYPKGRPEVPDGATASSGQMSSAKREVSTYNDEITAYLDCLKQAQDESLAALQREVTVTDNEKIALEVRKVDVEHQRAEKHNAAVDDLTAVVANFNEQVRRYQSKSRTALSEGLKEANYAMDEHRSPGSTAIGESISVLAAWGAPARSAQLGAVTLYTWVFVDQSMTGSSYSGNVDRWGNVNMTENSAPANRCEVTAQVNSQGIIEKVTRVGSTSSCRIPNWRSSR